MTSLWTNLYNDPSAWTRYKWTLGPFPKWKSRIGRVVQIAANPCSATPELWVYAAWVNAPLLIWSLFKPDPLDATYDRFGTGRRKRRRINIYAQGWISSTEKIPPGPGWAAFKLGGALAQRVGWYFAIADATTTFALNWVSTVYQWQGCDFPDAPYAQQTAHVGNAGLPGAHTFLFNLWNKQSSNIFSANPSNIIAPRGYTPSASFSLSTGNHPLTNQPTLGWSAELKDSQSGVTLGHVDSGITQGQDQSATFWYDGLGQGGAGHRYEVHVTKAPGPFWVTSGSFTCYGSDKRSVGVGPDP